MTRRVVRYGARRGQVGELWLPAASARAAGDVPVVVLIHGGFWRAQYTKVLMRRLARSVIAHGWAAWNIEYRRVGKFGGGGGWPMTFEDAATAVDELTRVDGIDLERVVTCGHSAGGQLALWLAARSQSGGGDPGGAAQVPVRAAVSLAGVADLRTAFVPGGAVAALMGGAPGEHPERYDAVSPIGLLPLGVPQVLVHGMADAVVSPRMSEDYVIRAVAAGDDAVFVGIPDAGHRDMLRPTGAGWSAALSHLERFFTS